MNINGIGAASYPVAGYTARRTESSVESGATERTAIDQYAADKDIL